MEIFMDTISHYVWDLKYRYRKGNTIIDHTIQDSWARVAKAVARVETPEKRAYWQNEFYRILDQFQFLPGGRILAGAGTEHDVTLFNCFVMPILEDSIEGIFTALKEGALTLQQGGGVGYDFSPLRPRGFIVKHTGALASGPVSFMKIWNAMCATMLSTGARRGAMMSILRCDHPDIEEFISVKQNANELRHFNLSVLVSNDFMQAVHENRQWDLVFPIDDGSNASGDFVFRRISGQSEKIACQVIRSIPARELWQKIIKAAYDYAEPGVIFEDTINLENNLWYREWITATNPCGEIPLPPYGACNLGAINLTQCVKYPFSKKASIDWNKITSITQVATRFLDNVIDISAYPLPNQKEEAFNTRRIGLGITGLADLLVMLNITYGSSESLMIASQLMKQIAETTWMTSVQLAKERGAFPLFQCEKFMTGKFIQKLNMDIQESIKKFGIRNSHHNTVAPTGTISLLANNISNGIEPIFQPYYERTVRSPNGDLQTFTVSDFVISAWKQYSNEKTLPSAWIDTHTLTPIDHLKIQSAIQYYVDNAISKTINIPVDFPFEKLSEVYTQAYQLGLKGCTIYRPNPITGSVLKQTCDEVDSYQCF